MLARRILTNFFNLSAGELLSRVATFLAFVHLARVLGTGPFGQISFVTTFVSHLPLVAVVAMLGAALALRRTPLPTQAAGALALYVAVLFLVGGALMQDLRMLWTAAA
jgi:O-antigen/teichoic acid export membrane protein